MYSSEKIIAFADKTVFSIKGLEVKGLNTEQVEDILTKKLGTMVRVIGVTSSRIEMDVYGISPEQIRRDDREAQQTRQIQTAAPLFRIARAERRMMGFHTEII